MIGIIIWGVFMPQIVDMILMHGRALLSCRFSATHWTRQSSARTGIEDPSRQRSLHMQHSTLRCCCVCVHGCLILIKFNNTSLPYIMMPLCELSTAAPLHCTSLQRADAAARLGLAHAIYMDEHALLY